MYDKQELYEYLKQHPETNPHALSQDPRFKLTWYEMKRSVKKIKQGKKHPSWNFLNKTVVEFIRQGKAKRLGKNRTSKLIIK